MVLAKDFVQTLDGFDKADMIPLSSYRECSTLFVTPTRTMMIPHHHDAAVRRIAPIQNQKRGYAILPCGEVSDAFNASVNFLLKDNYQFLFTLEDDNIPPWDVHLRLLDAMYEGGYDVIGGLYRSKAPAGMHMCWGYPEQNAWNIFNRDPREYIEKKSVMDVNALPTGCTIFRRKLFEDPKLRLEDGRWFRQVADQQGAGGHDIDFSRRARDLGYKLGVHCGVLVGHYDVSEGLCYWPHVDNPTRSLECPG